MRWRIVTNALLALAILPMQARGDGSLAARLQNVVDIYLAQRGAIESISGLDLHVDTGKGPPIDVFAGTFGSSNRPVGAATLFQIGSNTKHFTAALILKLEAVGKLNINQTVGDWLPQYPDWSRWTIKSLLDMTTDIPNYSETVQIGRIVASDPAHQFTPRDLIGAVYGKGLPAPGKPWFYSNTNNILAGLIIEKASGMSYREALRTYILKPLHLRNTFFSDGPYPGRVLARLPRGIYGNPECLLYQPQPCTTSTLAPLLGVDVSRHNLSWAGAAGAMISDDADLATWVRDLFGRQLLPQQQLHEMTQIVSQKTGQPITDVGEQDKTGFALDLGRAYEPSFGGAFWFYLGTTLGFRTAFGYWPQNDLVITASTNSQPPGDQDKFLPMVLGGAYQALHGPGR